MYSGYLESEFGRQDSTLWQEILTLLSLPTTTTLWHNPLQDKYYCR